MKQVLLTLAILIAGQAIEGAFPKIRLRSKPIVQFHHSIWSQDGSTALIIGGSNTVPGEFPFQVSLQLVNPSGPATPFCGGAILDNLHIITAAHCLEPETPNMVDIVAGVHNVFNPDGTEQRVRAAAWEIHEQFQPQTYNNDIALVRLSYPLTFNSRVSAIPVAQSGYIASGTCVNTGWGNIRNDGGTEYPEVLQKVTLHIFDRPICEQKFEDVNPITAGMICAGDERGNKGSCRGDSGGPLICKDQNNRDVLAGLVSWGVEPCALDGNYPSVFTNVAKYVDWIYG